MSYLYSKLPETGVSPHIGTGGGAVLGQRMCGYPKTGKAPTPRGRFGVGANTRPAIWRRQES
jgi:hypothetical protein